MTELKTTFDNLKKQGRCAFIPYFVLGFPDMKTSVELIVEASPYYDVLELGIPFSDPIADGPTIQEAAFTALQNNYSAQDFFRATKKIKEKTNKPIIYMLYYNLIFGYGIDNFFKKAKEAGVSGLIVPDMLPESDDEFIKASKTYGIDTIFLATPVTKKDRLKKITSASSGFLYLTSVIGITGQRDSVNTQLESFSAEIKKETTLPVCVGFGISKKEHVKNIAGFADGVIVGSAIVNKIIKKENTIDFIKELYSGVEK